MDHALNWLWQGSLVALVAAVLLAATSRAPAQVRYRIAGLGLGAVAMLPLLSLGFVSPATAHPAGPARAGTVFISLPDDWWTSERLVFALWAAWMFAAGARLVAGIAALARARRTCRPFPAAIEAQLPQWVARPAGRAAQLVMSNGVRSAAVLTGPTPFIAVNPALVESLEPADLNRIVMHEWAHVERRDDLTLFPQLAARIVAGWHPAAWWLDRRLQFEREVACDEWVVRLSGSAKAYAQCLATLARLSPRRHEALAAVGASPGSHLRQRVQRILDVPRTLSLPMRTLVAVASVLPLVVATAVADLQVIGETPAALVADVASAVTPAEPGDGPVPPALTAATTPASQDNGRLPRRARSSVDQSPSRREPGEERLTTVDSATARAEPAASPEDSVAPALANATRWSFTRLPDGVVRAPTSPGPDRETPPPDGATVWDAAANGGAAIGRGSQRAAVSTAGFFSRVGKSIARSF